MSVEFVESFPDKSLQPKQIKMLTRTIGAGAEFVLYAADGNGDTIDICAIRADGTLVRYTNSIARLHKFGLQVSEGRSAIKDYI